MENTSSPAQEEPSAAMDHSAAHSVATANAQDPPLSPSTRPYPEPSNEDDSPRKKRAVQDDSSQSHRQQVATDRHSQDSQTIQSNIDESDQDSAHDSNEEEENGISDYEKYVCIIYLSHIFLAIFNFVCIVYHTPECLTNFLPFSQPLDYEKLESNATNNIWHSWVWMEWRQEEVPTNRRPEKGRVPK